MYVKCGRIHKVQEYEHNCVMMHLKDNTIKVTHTIQIFATMWFKEYLWMLHLVKSSKSSLHWLQHATCIQRHSFKHNFYCIHYGRCLRILHWNYGVSTNGNDLCDAFILSKEHLDREYKQGFLYNERGLLESKLESNIDMGEQCRGSSSLLY